MSSPHIGLHSGKRVEFIHSLRGIAAMLAMLSHFLYYFWYEQDHVARLSNNIANHNLNIPNLIEVLNILPENFIGRFAVCLFFLISGFVIPFCFPRNNAQQFAVSRLFRI